MSDSQKPAPTVDTVASEPIHSPAEKGNAPYGAKMDHKPDPTRATYGWLIYLYSYFNRQLFNEQLPHCLISLQRKRGARGYFDARRFTPTGGSEFWDEIALNPRHWGPPFSDKDSISTLVHEQVHLWQARFGKPGRGDYHNLEFARKMFAVGLVTSSTSERGGKATGRSMSHYIFPGGSFDQACDRLLEHGFRVPYIERPMDDGIQSDLAKKRRVRRAESKTMYLCLNCFPTVRVWGKPRLRIICGCCDSAFVPTTTPMRTS